MNPEILSNGILAAIVIIPSLFGLTLLIALTVIVIALVHKRWTKRGNQAEAYYCTVGPPLLPARLEENTSCERNLEPLRIANTEHDIDKNPQDQFHNKIDIDLTENNQRADAVIHHQPAVIVMTNKNVAYFPTNTATATGLEIQTEENVAYSQKFVDTNENIAYGTDIAIAPEIQTEDNVAYKSQI